MKVVSEIKNKLLERREVVSTMDNASTPTRVSITEKLAEHFSVPGEQIVVNQIMSKFGSKSFLIDSFVYNSLEAKKQYTKIKAVKEAKK